MPKHLVWDAVNAVCHALNRPIQRKVWDVALAFRVACYYRLNPAHYSAVPAVRFRSALDRYHSFPAPNNEGLAKQQLGVIQYVAQTDSFTQRHFNCMPKRCT